jgi:hypothetical protein
MNKTKSSWQKISCFNFTAKGGLHEVDGVYQFKRGQSFVILDDPGGEWEVQSMW